MIIVYLMLIIQHHGKVIHVDPVQGKRVYLFSTFQQQSAYTIYTNILYNNMLDR